MLKLNTDNYREVLKQEREKQELSQNKLSELMGKSNSHVCRFESGQIKNPGANIIIEIANALGYEVCLIKKDDDVENPVQISVEYLPDNGIPVISDNLIAKIRKPAKMFLPLDDPDFLG